MYEPPLKLNSSGKSWALREEMIKRFSRVKEPDKPKVFSCDTIERMELDKVINYVKYFLW